MPSRSLNQIKNSINSYEYDDELLIAIDFGTVTDSQISADVIDNTLIVSHSQENASDQDIEFSLPAEFTDPEVSINNGIITIRQLKHAEVDTEEVMGESEDEDDTDESEENEE